MAVRQYIGARYVPRFMGTYDPTQQYEALDVVDNGSGTSYIARKNVPPGTPLTDAEYWFVYGASSGAILALQNRMDTAEQDIIDLNKDIDLLKYGDIILVSDSYGYSPSINDAWTGKLRDLIPNTCWICNGGGHGFGSTPSIADDFIAYDGTVTDPDKVGLIIAMMGYNDRTHLGDIPAGINNFVDHALLTYPNAKVLIGFIGISTNPAYNLTLRNGVMRSYKKYATSKAGCGYIAGSEYFMIDYSHMNVDGIHPNADGGTDIGHGIYNYLKTNIASWCGTNYAIDQTLTSSGAHNTAYSGKSIRAIPTGDNMLVQFLGGNYSLQYDSAQAPLQYIEFGTLSDAGFINGTAKEYCSAPIGLQIYTDTDPHWEGSAGRILFEGGKAYYKVDGTLNFTRVVIPAEAHHIPVIYC